MIRKQLLTVSEASMMLGIGRTGVYKLLGQGSLKSIRVLGSRRIPVREVLTYIERSLKENSDAVNTMPD